MGPKIDNAFRVPVSLDASFFRFWVRFSEPFHGLTNRQIDVVVELLYKRFQLSEHITDEDILDSYLMSDEVRKEIREGLQLTPEHYQGLLSQLKKKGMIVDGKLNRQFLPNIKRGATEFNLLINFAFNGTQEDNS